MPPTPNHRSNNRNNRKTKSNQFLSLYSRKSHRYANHLRSICIQRTRMRLRWLGALEDKRGTCVQLSYKSSASHHRYLHLQTLFVRKSSRLYAEVFQHERDSLERNQSLKEERLHRSYCVFLFARSSGVYDTLTILFLAKKALERFIFFLSCIQNEFFSRIQKYLAL